MKIHSMVWIGAIIFISDFKGQRQLNVDSHTKQNGAVYGVNVFDNSFLVFFELSEYSQWNSKVKKYEKILLKGKTCAIVFILVGGKHFGSFTWNSVRNEQRSQIFILLHFFRFIQVVSGNDCFSFDSAQSTVWAEQRTHCILRCASHKCVTDLFSVTVNFFWSQSDSLEKKLSRNDRENSFFVEFTYFLSFSIAYWIDATATCPASRPNWW